MGHEVPDGPIVCHPRRTRSVGRWSGSRCRWTTNAGNVRLRHAVCVDGTEYVSVAGFTRLSPCTVLFRSSALLLSDYALSLPSCAGRAGPRPGCCRCWLRPRTPRPPPYPKPATPAAAALQQWYLLDPTADRVMGVSVNRAYQELLAGKPTTPVVVAVIDAGIDTTHADLRAHALAQRPRSRGQRPRRRQRRLRRRRVGLELPGRGRRPQHQPRNARRNPPAGPAAAQVQGQEPRRPARRPARRVRPLPESEEELRRQGARKIPTASSSTARCTPTMPRWPTCSRKPAAWSASIRPCCATRRPATPSCAT